MEINNINSWEERFGWFWYGYDTVFNWEEKDFNKAAEEFHENGFTTAILFGTHFRFSYWAYWEEIENTIAKITKAFHMYGMKVVEHHSSHLTFRAESDAEWKHLTKMRKKWIEGFPNFRVTSQANPVLAGVHLDDFAQIDGSSGKIALSSYIHTEGKDVGWIKRDYIGNAHCFNHPSYYKAYTEHLERIIKKANIDGIMNDDVQWFGGGTTCTCEYCRKLFTEETGYQIPEPEQWSDFYENYDSPEYIAWKRFKKKSSGDFHRRLDDFYKQLDFHPLRPAYCAEVLPMDTTCYGFESASELWDYIFQECCGIIKYSYLCFAIEAVHRYALAQRKGVPSMALLYPTTEDSTYAAWAFSRSWGQLYTGTPKDNQLMDKPYRNFEKLHSKLYNNPKKISDLAFYFSEMTRDYTSPSAPQTYMKTFMSYMEAAYVSGMLSDMVFVRDAVDELSKHPVIVAVEIVMMGEDELKKLAQYVERGGKLIIIGEFATKDVDINRRTIDEGVAALGLSAKVNKESYHGTADVKYHGQTALFNKVTAKVVLEANDSEPILFGDKGQVLGVSEVIGDGEIIWIPCDIGDNEFQPPIWQNPHAPETDAYASIIPELRENNGKLLSLLVENKHLYIDRDNSVIGTIYEVKEGYAVHLVNTADMLPHKDEKILASDAIGQFTETGEKLDGFTLRVRVMQKRPLDKIVMHSPEFTGDSIAQYDQNENEIIIQIPKNLFSGYLLLHIKTSGD